MEQLQRLFEQKVQDKLQEIKSGSSTYGEAKAKLRKIDYSKNGSKLESLLAQEVERLLLIEINNVAVK